MDNLVYPEYSDNADISVINENFRKVSAAVDDAQEHAANKNNPHEVTAAQVGLGNVTNAKQATQADFLKHTADKTKHCRFDAGVYTGNGESSQMINIGFTPDAVFVFTDIGICYNPSGSSTRYYGGLAADGISNPRIEICSNGFLAKRVSDLNSSNGNNNTYYYIAFGRA